MNYKSKNSKLVTIVGHVCTLKRVHAPLAPVSIVQHHLRKAGAALRNQTVLGKWQLNMKKYKVSYGASTSYQRYGAVTAKNLGKMW